MRFSFPETDRKGNHPVTSRFVSILAARIGHEFEATILNRPTQR